VFTDLGIPLPAFSNGSLAWGDYDGDGDLDLVISGSALTGSDTTVWKNTGGTFANINTTLTLSGSAAWGDYDGDGDLDLLINGQLVRNDGSTFNTPPAEPFGLSTSLPGDRVVFSWNAPSDAQTPAAGLSYNLRVGTSPGTANVLSPNSDFNTGVRRLPDLGNARRSGSAFLSLWSLPLGSYYWSVQAVDNGFAGGPWAPEQSFVMADSDGDGLPDWWELMHGLNPNSAADAPLDFAGDGFTNAQKFAANLDPQDATNSLGITDTQPNGSDVILSFTTALHKVYRLERSVVSPAGPWTVVQDNVAGTGGLVSTTDVGGAALVAAYYHVILLP
jgi:hypothetical protein